MNAASNDNPQPKKETIHTGELKRDHEKPPSSLIDSSPQKHKRILVVDDNPDIVFTLRVGLESDPLSSAASEQFDNIGVTNDCHTNLFEIDEEYEIVKEKLLE